MKTMNSLSSRSAFVSSIFLICIVASATFISSCHKDKAVDTTPQLTAFDPESGAEGSAVTLKGKNFSTTATNNTVSFNGITATVSSVKNDGTEMMVTVPEGATTGKITVTVSGKSVTSTKDFTINQLAPAITTMAPDKGDVGTVVTLTGTHFKEGIKVFFNEVEVPAEDITLTSATQLTAKVPAGATNGKVKVVTGELWAQSSTDFYVKPVITSFQPLSGFAGDIITVTGTNFSVDASVPNSIKFGTVAVNAGDVQVISATELKVKVPAGSTESPVKLSINIKDQEVESEGPFGIIELTGFTPDHGEPGSVITINGFGLAAITQIDLIDGDDGMVAQITSQTDDQIKIQVPNGLSGTALSDFAIHLKTEDNEATMEGSFGVTNIWAKRHSYAGGSIATRGGYTANFYNGDKIYWGFGATNSGYMNDLVSYNIANPGEFVTEQANNPASSTMPAPRSTFNSVVLGNKVYIFGGKTETSTLNDNPKDIWEYDITANTYTKKTATLPQAHGEYTAFVVNGKIFVYFWNTDLNVHMIITYDPATDVVDGTPFHMWTTSPDLRYAQVQVIGETAYFMVGKKVISLKMANHEFKEYALPASARGGTQWSFPNYTDGSKIYFGGGFCSTCSRQTATDFYMFDPGTGSITQLASIPNLKTYINPYGVGNGKMYVLADDGMYEYIPNR